MLKGKFLSTFFTESILQILGRLIWINNKASKRVLNEKNFWFIDGIIHLLIMPRTNKYNMKRTEKKRSQSQEVTGIYAVLDS